MILRTESNRLDASAIDAGSQVATITVPKLVFSHAGVERTLNKHPEVQRALARGQLTLEQALDKPWFLRATIDGRERTFKCAIGDKDAIRAAKDILNGRTDHASEFAAFLAQRDAKRGLTLGQLADKWIQAGLPFSKTKPRRPDSAAELQSRLTRALVYWREKTANTVHQTQIEDFVVWRRQNVRAGARFSGNRSADIELGTLSSLCKWAVFTGQLKSNPFETREQYTTDIKHCHKSMPAGDDQFHAILSWLFSQNGSHCVTGAWLAFTALTGLRPGEHPQLIRQRPCKGFPRDLEAAAPGLCYRFPDGQWRMKVKRSKNGQNPAIILHAALRDFLAAWLPWRDHQYGTQTPALFPEINEDRLRDHLAQACRAVQAPALKPHGFGRAYYVRVRRSQGADDITISVELGQTTNGKLIRSTYGNPVDPVGGRLHDWLPGNGKPAWNALKTVPVPTTI